MVDDPTFYGVLIALIGVLSFLAILMVILKKKFGGFAEQMKVLTTLHAALFGYETALVDLIGTRGYRTHVFPKILNTINTLRGELALISDLDKAGSPLEAMKQWMKLLESVGVVKNGVVTETSPGVYNISLPHCMMCHPIHEIIGQQKGICPMALILTGAGTIVDSTKDVIMEYSTFTPTGTETIVKFAEVKGA
jgi:hypothetical protein